MVRLVDDRQGGRVRPAAGGRERERGGAVREPELVGVVARHRGGLERAGEAVVHAPQAEIEQVHRLVVALREEQHRRRGPEEHQPQAEANGQPADPKLPRLEDHAEPVLQARVSIARTWAGQRRNGCQPLAIAPAGQVGS